MKEKVFKPTEKQARYNIPLINPGDPEKGERSSLSGYWLGPPLIRPPCYLFFLRSARMRAPPRPAAAGSRRVGGRRCSQPSLHLPSTCPPLSPRALTRARYGGAALGLSNSGQLVPAARWRGARARAVQVRRRKRRRRALRGATGAECGASAFGVTSTEAVAAAAAAMEATTCARLRRNATVSSASLRSPRGRAPSGASVHAGSMPPASPTPLRRAPEAKGSVGRIARRCGGRHPSRTGGGDDGAIVSTRRARPSSLHAPRALPSSPPRLVRVRNPQRLLSRTDAGAAAACAAGAAPAADPPGCVGGVRRWRPRFPLAGSGCKFLYRETKRKAGPQPSPPGPI
jgi:hypothetical protein